MTKAQAKSSTKRAASKTSAKATHAKPIFQRWLIPGLITIVIYLVIALLAALYVKTGTTTTQEVSGIISFLFVAMGLTAFWWLIESARATMLYIERRTVKTSKKK